MYGSSPLKATAGQVNPSRATLLARGGDASACRCGNPVRLRMTTVALVVAFMGMVPERADPVAEALPGAPTGRGAPYPTRTSCAQRRDAGLLRLLDIYARYFTWLCASGRVSRVASFGKGMLQAVNRTRKSKFEAGVNIKL